MSPQPRPDMVQLTFEVPDRLLGEVYIAIGAVLKGAQDQSLPPPAEPELHDWGTEPFDSELVHQVWRKFSPRAQAVFALLMLNPGVVFPADEIAVKVGLINGRHALAGVVAWPSRQCAEVGLAPPFRFDPPAAPGEMGSYWMDPQTARLFLAARERALASKAGPEPPA